MLRWWHTMAGLYGGSVPEKSQTWWKNTVGGFQGRTWSSSGLENFNLMFVCKQFDRISYCLHRTYSLTFVCSFQIWLRSFKRKIVDWLIGLNLCQKSTRPFTYTASQFNFCRTFHWFFDKVKKKHEKHQSSVFHVIAVIFCRAILRSVW